MPYGPVTKVYQDSRALINQDIRLPKIKKVWTNCDDVPMNINYSMYYPDRLLQHNRNDKTCYRGFMKPFKGGTGFLCPQQDQDPQVPKIRCYNQQKFERSALPLNNYGRYKRSRISVKYKDLLN